MARVLITGSSGFLGKHLFMRLAGRHRVFGLDTRESCWTNAIADITGRAALFAALDRLKPDVIVHTAAWPDVEGCEIDKDKCSRINIGGTANVADWCAANGAHLIFISTDYVYGGNGAGAVNDEDSPTGWMNHYTYSKLEGEKAVARAPKHLIIRTGFIYGLDPGGKNFLMQMLGGRAVTVASDQVVNPTNAGFLCGMIGKAIDSGLTGTYNCNGSESVGRPEFARLIKKAFGEEETGAVIEKTTAEMSYKARRPLTVRIDSSRICEKLGERPKKIEEYLAELAEEYSKTRIRTFKRSSCRGCGGRNVDKIFSYGDMPVANSFQFSPDLNAIPLDIMFCNDCSLVQIWDVVGSESLFTDYRYLSSVSPALKGHFGELARTLKGKLGLSERSVIVEIGSNDGIFQEQARMIGLRVIGVEPARNVAALAIGKGFEVVNGFFAEAAIKKIENERGRADLIVGCNVLAHIDGMAQVLADVKTLLKDEGTLVFEVHYVVDLVKNREYDNMYHEHVNEYNLTSIKRMLGANGLALVDVEHIPNHGGSLRVYARKSGSSSDAVSRMLEAEEAEGFTKKETYAAFFSTIEDAKKILFERLNEIKIDGGRIAAYGASARGTIFLNYCNIGLNLLDFVVDKSPEKQGRCTPKNAIPILAPDALSERAPTHVLMAAYTYFNEIMREQAWYKGTWIVPLPSYREMKGVN